jgi:hypothetical protein
MILHIFFFLDRKARRRQIFVLNKHLNKWIQVQENQLRNLRPIFRPTLRLNLLGLNHIPQRQPVGLVICHPFIFILYLKSLVIFRVLDQNVIFYRKENYETGLSHKLFLISNIVYIHRRIEPQYRTSEMVMINGETGQRIEKWTCPGKWDVNYLHSRFIFYGFANELQSFYDLYGNFLFQDYITEYGNCPFLFYSSQSQNLYYNLQGGSLLIFRTTETIPNPHVFRFPFQNYLCSSILFDAPSNSILCRSENDSISFYSLTSKQQYQQVCFPEWSRKVTQYDISENHLIAVNMEQVLLYNIL